MDFLLNEATMIATRGADRWQDDHPNQITQWRAQLLESADHVFGAASEAMLPPVDVKALHAKIGELTSENSVDDDGANAKSWLVFSRGFSHDRISRTASARKRERRPFIWLYHRASI